MKRGLGNRRRNSLGLLPRLPRFSRSPFPGLPSPLLFDLLHSPPCNSSGPSGRRRFRPLPGNSRESPPLCAPRPGRIRSACERIPSLSSPPGGSESTRGGPGTTRSCCRRRSPGRRPFPLPRHPNLDIVRLGRRESQIARAKLDDAVWKVEPFQDLLRVAHQPFELVVRLLRPEIRTSSTLSNWCWRIRPRVSRPYDPASRRKHGV